MRLQPSTRADKQYRQAASCQLKDRAARRIGAQVDRLRRHGFLPLPLPNLLCEVDGLYLYRRTKDGYFDAVVVRAEDCAIAARVLDVFMPDKPLCAQQVVWTESGDLAAVVDGIVADLDRAKESATPRFSGELDVQPRGCLDALSPG